MIFVQQDVQACSSLRPQGYDLLDHVLPADGGDVGRPAAASRSRGPCRRAAGRAFFRRPAPALRWHPESVHCRRCGKLGVSQRFSGRNRHAARPGEAHNLAAGEARPGGPGYLRGCSRTATTRFMPQEAAGTLLGTPSHVEGVRSELLAPVRGRGARSGNVRRLSRTSPAGSRVVRPRSRCRAGSTAANGRTAGTCSRE